MRNCPSYRTKIPLNGIDPLVYFGGVVHTHRPLAIGRGGDIMVGFLDQHDSWCQFRKVISLMSRNQESMARWTIVRKQLREELRLSIRRGVMWTLTKGTGVNILNLPKYKSMEVEQAMKATMNSSGLEGFIE